jgi:8-oxo-dGTP pyrophosphatase MutT (NUDIX family)
MKMPPPNAAIAEVPFVMNVRFESSFLYLLTTFLRFHRLIHPPTPNMSLTFSEDLISQRLHDALQTAGPSSDGFSEITLTEETRLKCAAVLVPLVWQDGEWHLLYTRRTDTVESHKGQVSFPGGACDDGETTPEQTALREAEEEIGLRPDDVRVLGRLANLITITYFRVTPVVGVVKWPAVFRVGAHEVARVFTIPLGWLANPTNRWQFERSDLRRALIAYHPFDGELLWGASARITVDFLKVLGL